MQILRKNQSKMFKQWRYVLASKQPDREEQRGFGLRFTEVTAKEEEEEEINTRGEGLYRDGRIRGEQIIFEPKRARRIVSFEMRHTKNGTNGGDDL